MKLSELIYKLTEVELRLTNLGLHSADVDICVAGLYRAIDYLDDLNIRYSVTIENNQAKVSDICLQTSLFTG